MWLTKKQIKIHRKFKYLIINICQINYCFYNFRLQNDGGAFGPSVVYMEQQEKSQIAFEKVQLPFLLHLHEPKKASYNGQS